MNFTDVPHQIILFIVNRLKNNSKLISRKMNDDIFALAIIATLNQKFHIVLMHVKQEGGTFNIDLHNNVRDLFV